VKSVEKRNIVENEAIFDQCLFPEKQNMEGNPTSPRKIN